MKKLKELIYWIVFVIYEELIMAMLIFGKFPKTAPLIILLTLPFAIGLNILTSMFGKKANTVIAYILTLGECTTILDEMAQNWLRPCINLYTICNIYNTTPNKGFKI